jgi:hypothetical protein
VHRCVLRGEASIIDEETMINEEKRLINASCEEERVDIHSKDEGT